jgi:hypothetical protein
MIRSFTESDYPTICTWFAKRGRVCPSLEVLSKTGFITQEAAGFLYLTNSTVGIADVFITDPEAPKEQRRAALELLSQTIISFAKNQGVQLLKADSQFPSMVQLSIDLGFKSSGTYESFYKEL